MNWRNVKLIFWREVSDQFRDRRTLFMVILMPLFLYPVLSIGMMQMMSAFNEQPRSVLILNAQDLPAPALIKGGQFETQFFRSIDDADKVKVLTDDGNPEAATLTDAEKLFIAEVRERLPKIEELGRLMNEVRHVDPAREPTRYGELTAQTDKLKIEFGDWFEKSPVQVLVVVPKGLKQQVEEINKALASSDRASGQRELPAHPMLFENSADEKSAIAFRRVKDVFQSWEEAVLRTRLEAAELPLSISTPVNPMTVDLARSEKISANIWAKMFPGILVMMAVTGAFYPAIDLGAGEKERGTMETLLISPASRKEIVAGKFLTVMLFSISTALLNLGSIGYSFQHMLSGRPGNLRPAAEISFPGWQPLMLVILLAIPLSALFSALSLAFAMFARSTKEGQYYLTPLLMVAMGLMMYSLNPALELDAYYSVLPVVGPSMLLRVLLSGSHIDGLPYYALAVILSSLAYSLLALWWAIEQFQREDVLFRDAERFDLRLWLRHLLRKKEAIPSFSEALFCFLMILLAQFGFMKSMAAQPQASTGLTDMLRIQMIYAVVTIAMPAVLMAILLTSNPLKSLKLRSFHWKWLAAGIVLPFLLQPLVMELLSRMQWFFPKTPSAVERLLRAISDKDVSLWLALLVLAITPAICEELAFRGFILSGLQRTHRYRLAAVMSSVAFGIVHMVPQQVFNATLLGLVLAALALRSGSLIPGVVFHVIFNGTQVIVSRFSEETMKELARVGIYRTAEGGTPIPLFTMPVLFGCAILAVPSLIWLVRGPVAKGWRDVHDLPATDGDHS